jgi:hypothetical protein
VSSPGPFLAKAGLVLAALAVLHFAAWLLLGAGARREIHRLEAAHGRSALAAADDPGIQPRAGPRVAEWMRAQERWEARRTWERDRGVVATVGYALAASFLLQAAVLTGLLLRALAARRG